MWLSYSLSIGLVFLCRRNGCRFTLYCLGRIFVLAEPSMGKDGMMVNSNGQELLAWLDVETTSVKPEDGVLLEIGLHITSLDGGGVVRRSWVVRHESIPVTANSAKAIDMHTANELLEECFDWDRAKPLPAVEHEMLDLLACHAQHTLGGRLHPADTNPQFDLDWLYAKFSPEGAARLESLLSYRRLDLTAFRLGAQAKQLMMGVESESDRLPTTDHRVSTCLDRDLAEYRAWLGKGEE